MKIPPAILRYWLAMNATAFDSAVNSLIVYGGAATAHQACAEFDIQVTALTVQQLAIVFLSAFGWSVLQYLHAHPVAELLPAGPEAGAPSATTTLKTPGEGTRPTSNPLPTPNAQ
jgi:hypothetical protein